MDAIRNAVGELEKLKLMETLNEHVRFRVRHPGQILSEQQFKETPKGSRKKSANAEKNRQMPKKIGKCRKKSANEGQNLDRERVSNPPDLDPDLNQDLDPDLNLKKGLESDPEYRTFIERGIDALPRPPQGHYRAKLREKELQSQDNKEAFLKVKKSRDRINHSGVDFALEKEILPSVENTLQEQIHRKRGLWVGLPIKRQEIRAWCEQVGVLCGDDGPQLPTGDQAEGRYE
jgi:hypothetical protein